MSIRNVLRRIPLFYALNRGLKAKKTVRAYHATVRHYQGRPEPLPFKQMLIGRLGQRAARLEAEKGPPHIFFLGTDEAQDRSGLIQALEAYCTVTCFTRKDGSYGQNHPGPRSIRRQSNTERLLEMVAELAANSRPPDLILAQTWADFIDPQALADIRTRYGTVIVNIAMDDRHQYWGQPIDGVWGGTHGLIPHLDLALTAAPECADWYRKEGCPALFFPEASDPNLFYPDSEREKQYDVCFVGARYGIREALVLALRRAGIQVQAHGTGWEAGHLETARVPALFAQSKIVLGLGTIGHCEDFYALKLRDFDGPMSGSLYMTHDNPDLHRLYKVGSEIVTYRTIDDCVRLARHYLANDAEREAIATRGRQRAASDHTWERRVAMLLSVLRDPAKANAEAFTVG
ncbi:MAG: glycosyltransferase [Leptospirillia bacterium]